MSETSFSNALAEHECLKQVAIFGAERMAMVEGNEAGADITQDLISTVEALCEEAEGRFRTRGGTFTTLRLVDSDEIVDEMTTSFNPTGIFTRQIRREGDVPLTLRVNPGDRCGGFGATETDFAPVSVDPLFHERRLMVPKGFFPGRYDIYESLYVDQADGRPKILRVIETNHYMGVLGYVGQAATKLATAAEVDQSLDVIVAAVRAETEVNPAILEDAPRL